MDSKVYIRGVINRTKVCVLVLYREVVIVEHRRDIGRKVDGQGVSLRCADSLKCIGSFLCVAFVFGAFLEDAAPNIPLPQPGAQDPGAARPIVEAGLGFVTMHVVG